MRLILNDKGCDRLSSILEKTGYAWIIFIIGSWSSNVQDSWLYIFSVGAAIVCWIGSVNWAQEVRARFDSPIKYKPTLPPPVESKERKP